MVDFTYPELNEDLGTNTADGLRNLANTAANVYCDAYAAYAGAFAPGSSPLGLVRAIDAFNSRLCSPRNKRPPALPSSPFSGGQCPINYTVAYTGESPGGTTTGAFSNVRGPISGVSIQTTPGGQRLWGIQAQPVGGIPPGGFYGVFTADPDDPDIGSFFLNITSVTPQSGPDNCGNPAPQYQPRVAPEIALSPTLSVNLGGFTLNANAIIIPTKFEANANFDVGVEVKIGDFNIQFDAGGVTINNEFKPTVEINLPGSGDGRTPPPPSAPIKREDECPDFTDVETDLEEVLKLLKDIKKCACDEEILTRSYPTSGSLDVSSPEGDIFAAVLNVNTLPPNVRSQFGGGAAPDVYYLGWYSFGIAPSPKGDRLPISYTSNSFIAPKGAKSFSYTLYEGGEGILTLLYFKNPPP